MPEHINILWNNYKYCIVYDLDRIFFTPAKENYIMKLSSQAIKTETSTATFNKEKCKSIIKLKPI